MDRSPRSGTGYRSSEEGVGVVGSRQFSVPKRGFHDCHLRRLRRRFAMATSDNRRSRPRLLLLSQILIIMAFSVPRKAKSENCTLSVPFSNFLTKTAPFPALSVRRFSSLFPVISIHYRKARPSGTRRPIHSLFRVSTSAAFSAVSFAEGQTSPYIPFLPFIP